MKKLLIVALAVVGFTEIAGAQVRGKVGTVTRNKADSMQSVSKETAMEVKKNRPLVAKTDTVTSPRRRFLSPKTGQKATKAGQQATSINGTYSSNPKNAARSKSNNNNQ